MRRRSLFDLRTALLISLAVSVSMLGGAEKASASGYSSAVNDSDKNAHRKQIAAVIPAASSTTSAPSLSGLVEHHKFSLFNPLSGTERSLRNLRSPIENLTEPVKELQAPIDGLRAPLHELKDPLNQLSAPLTNLNQPLQNLHQPLHNLDQSVTGLAQPVDALRSPINNLRAPLCDLQHPVSGLAQSTNKLQQPLANVSAQLRSIQQPLGGLAKPLTGIAQPLNELRAPIDGLRQPLDQLSPSVSQLGGEIRGLHEEVHNLEQMMAETTRSISTAIIVGSAVVALAILMQRKIPSVAEPTKTIIRTAQSRIFRPGYDTENEETSFTTQPLSRTAFKNKYASNTDELDDSPVLTASASRSSD